MPGNKNRDLTLGVPSLRIQSGQTLKQRVALPGSEFHIFSLFGRTSRTFPPFHTCQ
jgi:hypothetical protein